ncbi:MAG: GyrI-like domain-containing protein [bacterium]|nr:GyrI-like domain-containing protein [bacterium]
MGQPDYQLPEPRIVKLDSFQVVGIEGKSSMKNNQIPKYWEMFIPREKEVKAIADPNISYGFCFMDDEQCDEENEETEFTVFIGLPVTKVDQIPDGMKYRTIPACEYVVFTHKGKFNPNGLQRSYGYIYGVWLPKSNLKIESRFNFEYYEKGRFKGVDNDDTEIDIYVPLKK